MWTSEQQQRSVALWDAAQGGNVRKVARLLNKHRQKKNVPLVAIWRAMYVAVLNDHVPVMARLIKCMHKAGRCKAALHAHAAAKDMFPLSTPRLTLLHVACIFGYAEMASLLVAAKADIQAGWPLEKRALHVAARHGHGPVVQVLVTAKANLHVITDSSSLYAVHYAIQEGHTSVVEILVRAKARVDGERLYNGGVCLAAMYGRAAVLETLAQCGVKLDNATSWHDTAPVAAAVNSRCLQTLQVLLHAKASANEAHIPGMHQPPLVFACDDRNFGAVQLLIEAGADVNGRCAFGKTPIDRAIVQGDGDILRVLLKAKADVEQPGTDGQKPLFKACWTSRTDLASMLLRAGANVLRVSSNDLDALDGAIRHGSSASTLRLLVRAKAVVGGGYRRLVHAVRSYNCTAVQVLLGAKAAVNRCGPDGAPSSLPLHLAMDVESPPDVARLLIAAKAAVDASVPRTTGISVLSDNHETPLFKAARLNLKQVVRQLLEARADPNKCVLGWYPVHVAAAEGHVDVTRILSKCVPPGASPQRTTSGRTWDNVYVPAGSLPSDVARAYAHGGVLWALLEDGDVWPY